MPKARDYHLNEQQLAEVEKAIRHDKRAEVRQRCTVIRLLHLGHKPAQVAVMQAISTPSVYGWYNRWRQDGIAGLANKPKSGRPAKADEAYSQALERLLEQEPKALGYDFAIWTVARLGQHLARKPASS